MPRRALNEKLALKILANEGIEAIWRLHVAAADAHRKIAVGMPITEHPPHRTGRAAFPHPAPTLD